MDLLDLATSLGACFELGRHQRLCQARPPSQSKLSPEYLVMGYRPATVGFGKKNGQKMVSAERWVALTSVKGSFERSISMSCALVFLTTSSEGSEGSVISRELNRSRISLDSGGLSTMVSTVVSRDPTSGATFTSELEADLPSKSLAAHQELRRRCPKVARLTLQSAERHRESTTPVAPSALHFPQLNLHCVHLLR